MEQLIEEGVPIELIDFNKQETFTTASEKSIEKLNRLEKDNSDSVALNLKSKAGRKKSLKKLSMMNRKTVKKMKKVLQLSWLRGAKFSKSQREELEQQEELEKVLSRKFTENRIQRQRFKKMFCCCCMSQKKQKEGLFVRKNPDFEDLDKFLKMEYIHYRIYHTKKLKKGGTLRQGTFLSNGKNSGDEEEKEEEKGVEEPGVGDPMAYLKSMGSNRSIAWNQSYFDKYGNEFSFEPYTMLKAMKEQRTATFYHFLDSLKCIKKMKKNCCRKKTKFARNSKKRSTMNARRSISLSGMRKNFLQKKGSEDDEDSSSSSSDSHHDVRNMIAALLKKKKVAVNGSIGATVYDKFGPGVNLFVNFTNLTILLLVVCSVLSFPMQYVNMKFFAKTTDPNVKPLDMVSVFGDFNYFLMSTTLGVSLNSFIQKIKFFFKFLKT